MPEDITQTLARKVAQLESELRRQRGVAASDTHFLNEVNRTVGTGKNFATIQAALDSFRGKDCRGCVIDVDPGSYSGTIRLSPPGGPVIDGTSTGVYPLILRGDQRACVGMSFVSGNGGNTVLFNRSGVTGGGNGYCTLSNAGNVLTVTGTGASPDFTALGLVAGDQVFVLDNSNVWTLNTIASVSGNTITFTGTCPTVGGLGSTATLVPNRAITTNADTGSTVVAEGFSGPCVLQGFLIRSLYANPSGHWLVRLGPSTQIVLNNCVLAGGSIGLLAYHPGALWCGLDDLADPTMSVISAGQNNNWTGIDLRASQARAAFAQVIGHGGGQHYGIRCTIGSSAQFPYATVANCQIGLYASLSQLYAEYTATIKNSAGFYSNAQSWISATNTQSLAKLNDANYNPAVNLTPGNYGAYIEFT